MEEVGRVRQKQQQRNKEQNKTKQKNVLYDSIVLLLYVVCIVWSIFSSAPLVRATDSSQEMLSNH